MCSGGQWAICPDISPTNGLFRRNGRTYHSRSSLSIRTRIVRVQARIHMITAVEYRAWAEESLKWAREAATESEREAYTKSAEIWLQSALRSEGPDSTTEYVWQLPPFQKWRRKGTPTQMAPVRSRNWKRHDRRSPKMTAQQAATLKRLAQAAYELEAFHLNLTRAEADLRIAMLTAKLKLLDEPPHTL
jgi:hypothetical protein